MLTSCDLGQESSYSRDKDHRSGYTLASDIPILSLAQPLIWPSHLSLAVPLICTSHLSLAQPYAHSSLSVLNSPPA